MVQYLFKGQKPDWAHHAHASNSLAPVPPSGNQRVTTAVSPDDPLAPGSGFERRGPTHRNETYILTRASDGRVIKNKTKQKSRTQA